LVALLPWLRGRGQPQQALSSARWQDDDSLRFVNSATRRAWPSSARVPRPFPAHQDQAALRRLESANRNARDLKKKLAAGSNQYRKDYAAYYEKCKHANSPAMRDPIPTVVLIPGLGMIAWGKDKSESRVTAEFYNCAVEVMRGAEAVDEIHRAAAAGGVRHRILAARGSEAAAHAGGKGTGAAGHRRGRRGQRHRREVALRLVKEGAHVVCVD
jgi:rhamnose utilization protein RhaD (predicted bifunctional aldolase and dehydrogenase)